MTVIVPEVDLGEVEFIDDLVVRLIEANSQQSAQQHIVMDHSAYVPVPVILSINPAI